MLSGRAGRPGGQGSLVEEGHRRGRAPLAVNVINSVDDDAWDGWGIVAAVIWLAMFLAWLVHRRRRRRGAEIRS